MLTDVVLPEINGPQVVDRIVLTHQGVRALFVSGYTDDALLRHGVFARPYAFLPQPFTPESLLAKVRYVLDAP